MTAETSKGWTYFNADRIDLARAWAEAELKKDPKALSPKALSLMCDWRSGGNVRKLISQMRSIAAKAPRVAIYKRCIGILFASIGQIEEAGQAFREAVEINPANTDGIRAYAELKKIDRDDPVLVQALALYQSGTQTGDSLGLLCFALAKMLDDIGEYEKAMHVLLEANEVSKRPYDVETDVRELRDLFEIRQRGPLSVSGGNDSEVPVFIVGMPRSGTTLAEAALGRHSRVRAGGEGVVMTVAERKILDWMRTHRGYQGTYMRLAVETPAEIFEKGAGQILGMITHGLKQREIRFVDKLPHNAMRLGLIARHFPRARIVYMRRHPLDTCLSNFFARFNTGHGHSFDLGALGAHYRFLAESVAIWRELIPNPILDISYELFVEDPENQTRRLVDFIGLEWEEACLAPQDSKSTVYTSSMSQVREPVHTRARERWRRYEPWLGPMIETMGGMDWIEAEFGRAKQAGARPFP